MHTQEKTDSITSQTLTCLEAKPLGNDQVHYTFVNDEESESTQINDAHAGQVSPSREQVAVVSLIARGPQQFFDGKRYRLELRDGEGAP